MTGTATPKRPLLTERAAWKALEGHYQKIREVHLRSLFADDPKRGEQMTAERLLGRRVVDLKRQASLLPKVPAASTESTPDRMAGGGAPGERRITGVTWSTPGRAAPTANLKVGGDVESWCGRCAELTTHSIVAMVGSEPKQVLCQVCGSRHTHRTTAARKTA